MGKRQDTIEIENALIQHLKDSREYGCEEITIGFANQGLGNEIVDFMKMNSKGIIRCYEIKVTIQDLKSNAKKSWYGHYNYLVVSSDLYLKVENWDKYIPKHIGIIVGKGLEGKRKALKCVVSTETEIMLKESMIRSMYWKMDKYKDAENIAKQKEIQQKIRKIEQEKNRFYERALKAEMIIDDYEQYKAANEGMEDINLELMARAEKEKYRKQRKESIQCQK